jgi:hypothetical protein
MLRRAPVLVLAILAALASSCAWFPSGPSSSDAVSYEVTGTGTVGLTAITIASPTAGAQQVTKDLNVSPFESALFAGWGQNATASPAVTATGAGAGSALACLTVRIIKNGHEQVASHDCGSPTITVSAK